MRRVADVQAHVWTGGDQRGAVLHVDMLLPGRADVVASIRAADHRLPYVLDACTTVGFA